MRLLTIFLSISLLGNATAQTFGLYTYTVNPDNASVTITDYPTNATGAIEIPATIDGRSVTSIGNYAFFYCSGLTSVIIPNSVTSIGLYAFSGCTGLTSIVVAVDNPNYSSIGPLLLNKNGTELIAVPSASGDFTIPDSVTSIADSAFQFCTGLTSIIIPNSVTSIGSNAFNYCSSLTSIVVAVDNPNYSSTGPLLLNKDGTVLIAGPGASGDFNIPNSVISIGSSAFSGCTGLTSATIGDRKSVV